MCRGAFFAMFASFGFLNAYAEYSLMYCSITQYADIRVSVSASSNPHTSQPHSVRTLRLTSHGSSLFNLPDVGTWSNLDADRSFRSAVVLYPCSALCVFALCMTSSGHQLLPDLLARVSLLGSERWRLHHWNRVRGSMVRQAPRLAIA